jgi:cytochrome P450
MSTITSIPSRVDYPSLAHAQDRHEFFATVRETAPVVQNLRGEFLVTRWEEMRHVLQNPQIFSSRNDIVIKEGWPSLTGDGYHSKSMIMTDPPDHAPKRKLGAAPFAPKRLHDYESTIQRYVDQLIDGFIDKGEADLIEEFGDLLPRMVVAKLLLGVDDTDVKKLGPWTKSEAIFTRYLPEADRPLHSGLIDELRGWITGFVDDRLATPGDDVISELARKQFERDGKVNRGFLISECSTLLMAGIVTTAHAMGLFYNLLFEHPDVMERLKVDPSRIGAAFEESLRLEPPLPASPRQCIQDTELGGVAIPAGASLMLLFAAANRDPRRFNRPDEFDIDRKDSRAHFTFAGGVHTCLGAPLSRAEVRLATETLLRRCENLRLIERGPRMNSVMNNGWTRLKVAFD